MGRVKIVLLAILFIFIAPGAIVWEALPVLYFLVMFAMEPAGWGCDEGPYSDWRSANSRVAPVLQWLDDNHLNVDLGEVTWLAPQIKELGHVKFSYSCSGAEPSLE